MQPFKKTRISNNESSLRVIHIEEDIWFSRIYSLYLDEMLMIAFSILKDEKEAEDIVAAVFEKLLNHSKESKTAFGINHNELKGYVFVSVRNACLDLLKTKKRREKILYQIGKSLQFWKRPEAYDMFEKEAIQLMIQNLSDREKQILEAHVKGTKNPEIAKMLGISEFTVRNTLHNARKRIRKMWNIFMR